MAAEYRVRRDRDRDRVFALVAPSWFIERSEMIPGRTPHRLTAHICSADTLERIVEPAIADLQKEYAMPTGVFVRAWVLVVGYFAIIKVISTRAVSVSTATADEGRAIVSTYVWCACIPPTLNRRTADAARCDPYGHTRQAGITEFRLHLRIWRYAPTIASPAP